MRVYEDFLRGGGDNLTSLIPSRKLKSKIANRNSESLHSGGDSSGWVDLNTQGPGGKPRRNVRRVYPNRKFRLRKKTHSRTYNLQEFEQKQANCKESPEK